MNKPACAGRIMRTWNPPQNPSNTANRARLQNNKSNVLTCFQNIKLHTPKLHRHIKTYNNKKLKQTERLKQKKKSKEKESLD